MNKEKFLNLIDQCKLTGVCEMFEDELFEFYNQAKIEMKKKILDELHEEWAKMEVNDYCLGFEDAIMHVRDTEPVEVRYHLNWMGPISADWIKKNGHGWAAGRMDTDYGYPYPVEISVNTMKAEDWNNLQDWLRTYKTFGLQTLDVIVGDFERETGHKITWFSETKE